MPKLLIVAQGEYFSDPRVLKQSISAFECGYDVKVYCYTSEVGPTEYKGVKIHRIPYLMINLWSSVREKLNEPQKASQSRETARILVSYFYMYIVSNVHIFIRIRRERADIIHATDLPTLLAAVFHKWSTGSKVVYDSHEMWVESLDYNPRWFKLLSGLYEWFLIKQVNAVTTVNGSIAKELSRRYHIPLPTVVMNCPFLEEVEQEEPGDEIKAIYQGRLVRNRGIEEMILAAKYLPPYIKIYIRGPDGYGNGMYLKELKKFVEDNGVEGRVEFLDPVLMVDLVKSLRGFHIGITPYKPINMGYDFASPNKIFEYMMAGLPVVASNLPELIKITGGAGVTFKAGSPEAMASAIRLVALNHEHFAYYARKKASEDYNWETQFKGLLGVYERVTQV